MWPYILKKYPGVLHDFRKEATLQLLSCEKKMEAEKLDQILYSGFSCLVSWLSTKIASKENTTCSERKWMILRWLIEFLRVA